MPRLVMFMANGESKVPSDQIARIFVARNPMEHFGGCEKGEPSRTKAEKGQRVVSSLERARVQKIAWRTLRQ